MKQHILHIVPMIIGGLALFLYAITRLSAVLKTTFSDRVKTTIEKYTKNIFSSILIGMLITIVLDSSSAVIIITIVFINASTISFRNAIGIIMGANIGTTVSSQIIALDVARFSIIPLVVGLVLFVFARKTNIQLTGKILLYFGMLFFGLFIIEESLLPLKNSDLFSNWMESIHNRPIRGSIIGGIMTLVIQSSSATIGMAIVLGKQQLISINAGIAIMLGAELGTCSDTLIASINGSRQAIKAALFHLVFNLTGILIALALFHPFVQLVRWITISESVDNHIANAHVLFSILGVLLFLPFVGYFERLLNWMLPDKDMASPQHISD